MANRKVVGIDYYGYILYEDDTPAFNSPFIEVINGAKSKEEKELWDKSRLSIKDFNNVILDIEYNGMEDGFDYVFKIPLFLEAKLMDIEDRDNIWKGGWTFNDRAKHFTPIKVREHNVDIPMLKTETKDEYLSRKCRIAKDNGEHIEPYMPEIIEIKDK